MSNMMIRTNVMALNSHRSLKTVGTDQSKASSRLSSGYKINSAADDAAGLAISEKMRSQIRGLDQASVNAQDAISLIQTAEGGMQEIDNMIQRIRELVVKASNDTNDQVVGDTKGDRQKIQDEIDNLVAEIDSMADRVQFNNKNVIDGTYNSGTQVNLPDIKTSTSQPAAGAGGASAVDQAIADLNDLIASDEFIAMASEGDTDIDAWLAGISSALSDLTANGENYTEDLDALVDETAAGTFSDGIDAATTADAAAYATIKGTLESIIASLAGGTEMPLATTGSAANLSANITAALGDAEIDAVLTESISDYTASQAAWDTLLNSTSEAEMKTNWDAFVAALKADDASEGGSLGADLLASQTSLDAIGQVLADKLDAIDNSQVAGGTGTTLYFQVGANADQKLELNINSVKSDALGIGNGSGKTSIDVVRATGSEINMLLDGLDDALSVVTTERSKLGAAQNRLEYTMKSLDISSENLSAAEGRIRNTDMAKEMMNLTQANVLQQAATSMLAQANQAPQSVLQLLQ